VTARTTVPSAPRAPSSRERSEARAWRAFSGEAFDFRVCEVSALFRIAQRVVPREKAPSRPPAPAPPRLGHPASLLTLLGRHGPRRGYRSHAGQEPASPAGHSEIVLFWEKKEIGRKYPAPGPLVAMDVRRMRGVSSCNRCGRGAPAPRRGRQQGAQAASVEVCDVRGAARRGAPPSAVLPGRGPPCAAHPALPGAVRRSRGWGASARRTWHRGAARCARHPQAALARATAPAPSMPACPTRRDARPCAHSAGARARRASKQMP